MFVYRDRTRTISRSIPNRAVWDASVAVFGFNDGVPQSEQERLERMDVVFWIEAAMKLTGFGYLMVD